MSVFTTKKLKLVPDGVELDLNANCTIESVTVILYPNGGTGDFPKETITVKNSQFQGTVRMKRGGTTVNRATVIAALPDDESENLHCDEPDTTKWAELETESPGPSGDFGCPPDGCPPSN